MGMPCEINSVLKLTSVQVYPASLEVGTSHRVQKTGYRIFPLMFLYVWLTTTGWPTPISLLKNSPGSTRLPI